MFYCNLKCTDNATVSCDHHSSIQYMHYNGHLGFHTDVLSKQNLATETAVRYRDQYAVSTDLMHDRKLTTESPHLNEDDLRLANK